MNSTISRSVAVIGFGKTGKAVLDFFLERNSNKTLYLYNDTPITDSVAMQYYKDQDVTFLVGEEHFCQMESMELIILSPGVDGKAARFTSLREKGIRIVSEIELAFAFIEGRIIAVTGTNGKSTTVSLIHHILSAAGVDSYLTGNIGTPLIAEASKISSHSVVVVEVSSFQLEEIAQFRPDVSVILNITPDHLDRYKDIDTYFAAKLNMLKNQGNDDWLVLNADDAVLGDPKNKSRYGRPHRAWFSLKGSPEAADNGRLNAYLSNETLKLWLPYMPNSPEYDISLAQNPLRGLHNLENIMAASIAAGLVGVPPRLIESGIATFKGLEHRMETAGKIKGVEFINDTKATNVDAALKSIGSIDDPLVLILGGKDKGSDFTVLEEPIRSKVDHVLLMGHAADIIANQLENVKDKFVPVTDMAHAVRTGLELLGNKGGVVLLAPGCASFDMFNNFEHRGKVFKEEVAKLAQIQEN